MKERKNPFTNYYLIPFLQSYQVDKSNLWWGNRIVVASMWDCGGDWLGIDTGEISGMLIVFCILTGAWSTHLSKSMHGLLKCVFCCMNFYLHKTKRTINRYWSLANAVYVEVFRDGVYWLKWISQSTAIAPWTYLILSEMDQ